MVLFFLIVFFFFFVIAPPGNFSADALAACHCLFYQFSNTLKQNLQLRLSFASSDFFLISGGKTFSCPLRALNFEYKPETCRCFFFFFFFFLRIPFSAWDLQFFVFTEFLSENQWLYFSVFWILYFIVDSEPKYRNRFCLCCPGSDFVFYEIIMHSLNIRAKFCDQQGGSIIIWPNSKLSKTFFFETRFFRTEKLYLLQNFEQFTSILSAYW